MQKMFNKLKNGCPAFGRSLGVDKPLCGVGSGNSVLCNYKNCPFMYWKTMAKVRELKIYQEDIGGLWCVEAELIGGTSICVTGDTREEAMENMNTALEGG